MNTMQLIFFAALLVLVTMHRQKRYYLPPVDWKECGGLNKLCSDKLADVENLLKKNCGFRNLVTDGTLNLDCSAATRADNNQCFQDAANMCRSNLDFTLKLWKKVYGYICGHQAAFIRAEPCLKSGVLTVKRRECNVGAKWYASEEDCRTAPSCMKDAITANCNCTAQDADLFKGMIEDEYTLKMGRCNLRYY